MSPTTLEVQQQAPQAKKQRTRSAPRAPRQRKQQLVRFDEETREYSMVVRSTGVAHRCKRLTLVLAEPGEGEECSIALEPIQEYRLPFIETGGDQRVSDDLPQLTKASLPCRHGFNALALLYHFAKNSMTCPCCRAGHANARMCEASIPPHLRRQFSRHLRQTRLQEDQEQIAADAALAAAVMHREVSRQSHAPSIAWGFAPTRVVLLLIAYDSMDGSSEPMLVLELPLSSSLTGQTLGFASSGLFLHQLSANMRFMPVRPRAFEIVVGLQSMLQGNLPLFRTVRFPAEGAGHRVVFSNSVSPGPHAVHVETCVDREGNQVFSRLFWPVSVEVFAATLISITGMGPAQMAMV